MLAAADHPVLGAAADGAALYLFLFHLIDLSWPLFEVIMAC
jgi:hypothetical protein